MSVRSIKYVRLSVCHICVDWLFGGGGRESYPTKFGRDNHNKEK